MKRTFRVGSTVVVGVVIAACSGSTGPAGATGATGTTGTTGMKGAPGTSATATPSVSAITPPYAFLGRSITLSIAGSGTAWDSATTVSFADPKVTVNKVTVASVTGLLVDITVASDATVGPDDVTVTDAKVSAVYKGAFEVRGPLTVTSTPATGVPQGGLANLHVVMSDLTTPFDPNTTNVTLSSTDLQMGTPSPTDYAFDLTIEADVLAKTGTFDMDVTSGMPAIDSPAAQSFKIAPRAPTTATSTAAATGNLETDLDTELYQFTPASASQEFVQFNISSTAGTLSGTVIPPSGKYADAISQGFSEHYGQGTTATSLFYVVVGDSNNPFTGPGPTPADTALAVFESPCTSMNEESETTAMNDDTAATAQPVTTLPALVSGVLGYGSVAPAADVDYYAVTVTGSPKTIHVATGGDPLDDTVLYIYDSATTGAMPVATSDDLDYQEDLSFTTPSNGDGTYYIQVAPSQSGAFSASDNTYQLFIDVK